MSDQLLFKRIAQLCVFAVIMIVIGFGAHRSCYGAEFSLEPHCSSFIQIGALATISFISFVAIAWSLDGLTTVLRLLLGAMFGAFTTEVLIMTVFFTVNISYGGYFFVPALAIGLPIGMIWGSLYAAYCSPTKAANKRKRM